MDDKYICYFDPEILNDGIARKDSPAKRRALAEILKESRFNLGCSEYEARWGKLRPDRFKERDAELVAGIVYALKLTQNSVDDKKSPIYNRIIEKLFADRDEHSYYKNMDSAMRYKYPNTVVRTARRIAGRVDDALGIHKIGYCSW